MAHHKSALKRIEVSERNRTRNRHYISQLRTEIKKVRSATNKEEAQANYRLTASLLDKLAQKNIIHKNKAANQKAKLAELVNKIA
ncbi:MAG TPA: 30S ribosomal protein S20 [bacterium]|jgi:small subunit ribosomal protein S20|nr:30S ribosomal protein S20 [bacterium]HNT64933.1 30S ribosomal protein S20 [bacterium]HOX84900.1 30S ribosomal protein S20 [bacterium]HPG44234.1 30S ribosomal protein S20 [bacterium]HPM96601.1 30S ribosomal protein S20 [bacterium]